MSPDERHPADSTHDDEELGTIFNAMTCPVRRRLVTLLADGPLNVSDMSRIIGMPQPTISHHLGLLKMARLIYPRRIGKCIFYSLVADKLRSVRTAGETAAGQAARDRLTLSFHCAGGAEITIEQSVPPRAAALAARAA